MPNGEKRKICIVTSTRADWGLLCPLASRLREMDNVIIQILATNMHLSQQYGYTIREIQAHGFHVDERVAMDMPGNDEASVVRSMARCMDGTAGSLERLRPDIMVLLGDRYEMLAVASAATVMKIPIVHIAGGEITWGAIDDSIRHAITKLSSLHLTSTEEYRKRVIQMGEDPQMVINTGAIGVWNIMNQKLMSHNELERSLGFSIPHKHTLLITFHPATMDTVSAGMRCRALTDALGRFSGYTQIITYPNNDAGSEDIIRIMNEYALSDPDRIKTVKSLGMIRYLSALQYVNAVIGNSSSGIVEVPSMGIPSVDIGIRQEGRIAARSVIHCGDSADDIASAIEQSLSPAMQALAAKKENPYYRNGTIETMVRSITETPIESLTNKTFHDIGVC